ncbi:MAG: hypothetical protein RhofKO_04370 [Rhodothermales bacterium]
MQQLPVAARQQNWFATIVQFLIVVLGIIIGFQVTAWGNAQADRAKEQVYLQQLEAEFETTMVVLEQDDVDDAPGRRATYQLVRAFYEVERPPADTLMRWYNNAIGVGTPRPPLGTIEALIATGDLRLIRDADLRANIALYLEEMRGFQAAHVDAETRWREAAERLDRYIDPARAQDMFMASGGLEADAITPDDWEWSMPPQPRRNPFPFDVEQFLQNRAAFDAVYAMSYGRADMDYLREVMQEATTDLLEQVQEAQQGWE